MSIADSVAGALRPSRVITWTREDDAETPEDLTGATLSGVIVDVDTGVVRAIAGTLNLTDAANGVFTWIFNSADVVEGSYLVQFTASFPSGTTPAKTKAFPWTVYPSY